MSRSRVKVDCNNLFFFEKSNNHWCKTKIEYVYIAYKTYLIHTNNE